MVLIGVIMAVCILALLILWLANPQARVRLLPPQDPNLILKPDLSGLKSASHDLDRLIGMDNDRYFQLLMR